MLKWLVHVLIGWPWCAHKWVGLEKIQLFTHAEDELPSSWRFILQCEKCGDVKARTL